MVIGKWSDYAIRKWKQNSENKNKIIDYHL